MEHDGLGLDFPVLDVHLIAGQHDGDVLAHPAPRLLKEYGLTATHHTPQPYLTKSLCQLGTFL